LRSGPSWTAIIPGPDAFTVDSGQLELHFQHLRSKGYQTILLSELIAWYDDNQPLPPNPVLITFDDGFRNNYLIACPLAEKYQMKINFFLVPAFIMSGRYREEACMSKEEIRRLNPALVEVGLHSFSHDSYAELIPSKIESDIELCLKSLKAMGIPYQPCLAYPYGAYPRRKGYDQSRLFEILEEKGVRLAFRIGNRINRLPLRRPFLIQRLDIKGGESLPLFRASLAFGRKRIGLSRFFYAISGWKDMVIIKMLLAFFLGIGIFIILVLLRHGC
jgi:peptidoglycan/xylan/chitin deacetylase (PgdA/CDA1 family)